VWRRLLLSPPLGETVQNVAAITCNLLPFSDPNNDGSGDIAETIDESLAKRCFLRVLCGRLELFDACDDVDDDTVPLLSCAYRYIRRLTATSECFSVRFGNYTLSFLRNKQTKEMDLKPIEDTTTATTTDDNNDNDAIEPPADNGTLILDVGEQNDEGSIVVVKRVLMKANNDALTTILMLQIMHHFQVRFLSKSAKTIKFTSYFCRF
jgi:hypothetical protein